MNFFSYLFENANCFQIFLCYCNTDEKGKCNRTKNSIIKRFTNCRKNEKHR